MKILNIPLESIPMRYSIQWDQWFTNAFLKEKVNFETIYGAPVSETITTGSFLDVCDTNIYKLTQAVQILEFIKRSKSKEPLLLFFHDLWNPALTSIAYMRDGLERRNIKICGCLHAGSYDPHDFLTHQRMDRWAEQIENAWFGNIVDRIYVATNFHKELLCKSRLVNRDKVIVTGFPLFPDFLVSEPPSKERIVVFPHRLDPEKQPEFFDMLSKNQELQDQEWKFIRTKDVCKTKADYYWLLHKATFAISFATQETWGIAMQEATLCGAMPIVPRRLSYPELYLSKFIFDTQEQIVNKILSEVPRAYLEVQQDLIKTRGEEAIPKMIADMRANYGSL